MNRYSQISTSQFNPLSLEEVMAAPLYKQKQYDALEADRVATQEAFKVDPDNKYLEEAQRLQNDFNAKADELARYQLKTGDLQGAKSKMLDLRKEYKRLTDPMGAVSQINNDKININKQREDTILNMTKLGFSPKAAQNYFEKQLAENRKSPLYNKQGQIDTFRPNLPNQYQDYIKTTQDFMKDTGVTSSEIKTLRDGFVNDINSGISYTEAIGKMRSNVSNKEQRDSVVAFMKDNIFDESSPVRQTMDIEGVSVDDALSKIEKMSGIYKKYTKSQEDTNNIGNVQRPEKIKDPDGVNYPDSIPEKVIPLNNNENLLTLLKNPFNSSGRRDYINSSGFGQSSNVTKESTLNNNPDYIELATKIKNITPSLKNLKLTDQKVINKTVEYLENHKNTQTVNRIITPTTNKDLRGYSPDEIAKYTKMKQDAMQTSIMNGMKVYDEEGNQIENPISNNIIYNGEYTFNSIVPIKSTNPKTKYAPIAATLLEKNSDGITKERRVYVEQNPDREKEPLFNAQYLAKRALEKANKFRNLPSNLKNSFTEENLGLRDVKITYNDDDSIILEGKHFEKNKWINTPPQIYANDNEFINSIYNLHK